jgi:hypothetical protein
MATVKVSTKTYDRIKKIAEERDLSISSVADSLLANSALSGAIQHLVTQDSEKGHSVKTYDGMITEFKNGDQAYICAKCKHPINHEVNPEECPFCGAILDWKAVPLAKETNWALWVLGGLVVLGVLSASGVQVPVIGSFLGNRNGNNGGYTAIS